LIVDACGPGFRDFLVVPSVGASGGLLIAWNEDIVHLDLIASNQYFILASCQSKITGESWYLGNVYGPQGTADKLAFLADLKAAVEHLTLPLALLGDFNLISEATDKSNSNYNRGLMLAFRKFMNELELKDLYLHGRRFTWSNEQVRSTLCRLDRVLYNNSWHDLFPRALLQAVSSSASDHSPLVLTLDADFKPNRRFRFETFWARRPDFLEQV
jgi:exonuclease III